MTDTYNAKNIFASANGVAPLTFTVTFRAARDANGVKALRWLLKYALRACGLRAIDIRQSEPEARHG
jgi:hypothetical protein